MKRESYIKITIVKKKKSKNNSIIMMVMCSHVSKIDIIYINSELDFEIVCGFLDGYLDFRIRGIQFAE